jgi:hypothetical protein
MVDKHTQESYQNTTMHLFQAIRWRNAAWEDDVTATTIANCCLQACVLGHDYRSLTKAPAKEHEKI